MPGPSAAGTIAPVPAPVGPIASAQWTALWSARVRTVLALGALGFVYSAMFLGSSGAFRLEVSNAQRWALVAVGAAFVAIEYPRARRREIRRFARCSGWLDRADQPTEAEAEAFNALPRAHATSVLAEWSVATVIATGVHAWFHPEPATIGVLVVGGLVFGVHIAGIVYVLAERALRPSFRRLAALDLLSHGEPGMAARLLAAWTLGAGFASIGAVLILGWPDHSTSADLGQAVLPLIAFVLVEGGALTVWAVRSMSRSVVELQQALQRVEAGDLDVNLATDDRTELGALRRSFNAMVQGLRDGAHVERLLDGQVGPDVARVTRTRGVQLDGERAVATVLSVDMIGSTAFAERNDPERLIEVLNGFFDLVVRRVSANGGNVLQFQGDGALCVFGAPSPLDDHEARALRAARELRDDVLLFRATNHPDFDAAVAVATGNLVVGHVGNADRFSYTVIGDVVNEACRLGDEAKATESRVLATSVTVARCGDEARWWRASPPRQLRGRATPTAVHRLVAPRLRPGTTDRVGKQRHGRTAADAQQGRPDHGLPAESVADVVEDVVESTPVVPVER